MKVFICRLPKCMQGRSQNSREVPQNFVEVLNIDDVTGNDIIQRNQHRKENKIKLSSALITGVNLASQLKKNVVFHLCGKSTIIIRSPVRSYACILASLYHFDKSLRRTFSQLLPFQSMNSNTTAGCERCSRLIKKDSSKTNVNCCSALVSFGKTLHLV